MSCSRYIAAVNPEGKDKPHLNLIYSQTKVSHIRKLGFLGAIKEAAELVPLTLQHPDSIFGGLRPPDDKYSGESPGWLCYCSRPPHDYTESGEMCNPMPNKVFLVFVNEEQIIYNWRWEDADIAAFCNKEYLPKNFSTRFRRRYL
jgi:hypothetical protein